jgi:hypothetical protein
MAVVVFKGVPFKHNLSESELPAAITEIDNAIAAAKVLRQEIAFQVKQNVAGLPAIAEFLGSPEAKLACAFEAAKKQHERYRPALDKLRDIQFLLKVNKPLPEVDWVRVKLKKNGDPRPIHDFGWLHRTAKQMVLRVMGPFSVSQPFQKTFMALPHIVGIARSELLAGKHYFATLDIKDHFGSFSITKLAQLLPLPKEVVDYVVGGRHVVVKFKDVHPLCDTPKSALLFQAQRGLPQGSICSPIIAAYSVSFLQWTPDPHWILLNYSDNFLLLADSEQALEKGIEKLMAAVGKLPGGKFKLKLQSQGHAAGGFTFLGHTFEMAGGKVRISPCVFNEQSIYGAGNWLASDVACAMGSGDEARALEYVRAYCARVKGWLAAFAACDDIAEHQALLETGIATNSYPLVINVKEMMQSVASDYEYSADEYQYV